ncbi:MAG: uridine kinase [Gammaproteobacteria bacterium]|nr:uridine kinase [Gammaproteobacteria bacterium]
MIILAINGASASGKSTYAHALAEAIFKQRSISTLVVTEDSYYRANDTYSFDERALLNYDHPNSFEHSMLVENLKELRTSKTTSIPQYCYKTHNRKPDFKTIESPGCLILEGIHLLTNPDLAELFDYRIFIDVPLDICLARRVARDTVERSREVPDIIRQYMEQVRPMFLDYIEPNKYRADLQLDGTQPTELIVEQTFNTKTFIEKLTVR